MARTLQQWNLLFNDWWAFEALYSYDIWFEDHRDDFDQMEDYWARLVELSQH